MRKLFIALLVGSFLVACGGPTGPDGPGGPGGDLSIEQVYTGLDTSFALLDDGRVLSWGRNSYGVLGNGTELVGGSTPALIAGLTDVQSLAVARNAVFARTDSGAWYAWGSTSSMGQEVQADPNGVYSPQRVRDLGDAELHGAMFDFFLAHEPTGEVQGWGFNYDGQATGVPTRGVSSAQLTPATVPLGGLGVKLLAPVDVYSIAVMADDSLRFWGSAAYGPGANVSGLQGVVTIQPGLPADRFIQQIAGAHFHVVVLLDDGSLWAWGGNDYGQFGDPELPGGATAAELTAFPREPIRQVATTSSGTVVLYEDGSVWRSGIITPGRMDDFTVIDEPVIEYEAAKVEGLPPIAQVAANGTGHVLALAQDGDLWAWGANAHGELGNGSTTDSATPVKVGGL